MKDNSFTSPDFYNIDDLLTEEHKLIRESTRSWVNKSVTPIIEEYAQKAEFPSELISGLAEIGAFGPYIPTEYGGAGLDQISYGLMMQEIEGGDSGIRSTASVQSSLVMYPIWKFGSDEQKEKFLPKLASGEMMGCFGLTEPDHGSDPGGMITNFKSDGDDVILNGAKMWITNGPNADTLVVYAKTDPSAVKNGITAFIVQKGMKGFSTSPKLDKMGMRGSNTCELIFDNCEVPETNVLGSLNEGVKVLMSGLDYERAVLAAGPIGIMQACMDVVLPYVHDRKQFGQPIGEFQLMQGKLADMYVTMNASKSYVYSVAKACDRGEVTRKDAAGAILYAAERASWMASEAIQCLGGNGYINDYPTGRLLRDAKLYEIGAGTSEIRRMLIGRELYKETS